MANECSTIRLYLNQTDVVWKKLQEDGIVFSKAEYVRRKYEESADVFMTIYSWFAGAAQQYVPRPEGAELPYWAQRELMNIDT